MNHNALQDARVRVIVDDAFSWLRKTSERDFAAIFADFPYPYDGESLRLYSVEFYKLVRSKMQVGGFFIADYPLQTLKNRRLRENMQQTFFQAGLASAWWLHVTGESFIIATREKKDIHKERLMDLSLHPLPLNPTQAQAQSVLKPHKFMDGDPFF